MKQIFLIILLLFISSFAALAQTKNNDVNYSQIKSLKASKKLVLEYDEASNMTKVMAFGEDFGHDQNRSNNLSAFSFGMTFSYQGKSVTSSPQSFITTFWAEGKKSGFSSAHALTIVVDGETFELGEARYAKKKGGDTEYLNFNFPREVLEKIVAGKNVQMKMGNANFKFTAEHLKLFSGLLAISSVE